jgi:hypothetical protein
MESKCSFLEAIIYPVVENYPFFAVCVIEIGIPDNKYG